jgi:hypothetical protein
MLDTREVLPVGQRTLSALALSVDHSAGGQTLVTLWSWLPLSQAWVSRASTDVTPDTLLTPRREDAEAGIAQGVRQLLTAVLDEAFEPF